MIGLTMKHLRYFDALAREGHFGRAAEACSVTQPALSVQIRELEALVGAPLIERGPRGNCARIPWQFNRRHETSLSSCGVESARNLARLMSV